MKLTTTMPPCQYGLDQLLPHGSGILWVPWSRTGLIMNLMLLKHGEERWESVPHGVIGEPQEMAWDQG